MRGRRRASCGDAVDGGLRGVEAVIDKDFAAALLAESVVADCFMLLTDVAGVWPHWPQCGEEIIRNATPAQLRAREFATGSMAPKVEAACRFVERSRTPRSIGAIGDALAILEGEAGTIVGPRPEPDRAAPARRSTHLA